MNHKNLIKYTILSIELTRLTSTLPIKDMITAFDIQNQMTQLVLEDEKIKKEDKNDDK